MITRGLLFNCIHKSPVLCTGMQKEVSALPRLICFFRPSAFKTKPPSLWVAVSLTAVLMGCLIMQSCLSTPENESQRNIEQVFNASYDEVWSALENLILNDLGCAAKKINKKKGFIETEWVHRIDTEGTMRWKIRAKINKRKSGVGVLIDKEVQAQDEVRRNINRYRKETRSKDVKPMAGWTKSEKDLSTIKGFYKKIENKLQTKGN